MLAARDVTGDNTATAGSLAAVLASIARGDVPGVTSETHEAMRDILFLEDAEDGRHFYKGGSLNSNPLTRVLSGYYDGFRGTRGPGARFTPSWPRFPDPRAWGPDDLEAGDAGRAAPGPSGSASRSRVARGPPVRRVRFRRVPE